MATRDITTDDRAMNSRASGSPTVVRRQETKPSFLTTEFWAMAGAIAAILVAAQQADNFDAPRAWTLVAAVVIGYMVSRGLAKSGSAHRDRDDADRL
jgi:glycerol-3-phosphate acyltransferase PlsY